MLAANPVVRIPDPVEAGTGPQIINVPVRPLRDLFVVRDAGLNAARTHGAADVNIGTSPQLEWAELSDLDHLSSGTRKN
jgi:hypothetical protein